MIAILIIKFFFEGSYAKLQKWYQKNILDETTVTAFFEEEEKAYEAKARIRNRGSARQVYVTKPFNMKEKNR